MEKASYQKSSADTRAHTLFNSVSDTVERFDSCQALQEAAESLLRLLDSSRHIVCFTGAGISAAAGIPTYRGAEGIDTVELHGGGEEIHESRSGAVSASKKRKKDISSPKIDMNSEFKRFKSEGETKVKIMDENEEFSYGALRPTFTHRALAGLHSLGKMQYCITQNCDDLHARGGFPRSYLSELHGNVFCEFCEKCYTEYYRDYEVDAWSTNW